jgi:hypothetical protein
VTMKLYGNTVKKFNRYSNQESTQPQSVTIDLVGRKASYPECTLCKVPLHPRESLKVDWCAYEHCPNTRQRRNQDAKTLPLHNS